MELEQKPVKTKYLHGRPEAHYTHANFARSVGADFEYIDFKYRWQDKKRNIFYIIYSWFYCAKNYTNRKLYDIFLVDGLHFSPVIMKYFFLKRKRQKIAVYLGSHTMYFFYARKFSKLSLWMHRQALRSYDGIICEGEMSRFFVQEFVKKRIPPIYDVFNGIPVSQDFSNGPENIRKGKKILFVGVYNSQFRFEYKGIDIMIRAFEIAFKKDRQLTFTLLGAPEENMLSELLNSLEPETRQAIKIIREYTANLEEVFSEHDVYLHCARGDNFPTVVLIALSSGMPAIVNELNGTRVIIKRVNPNLVTNQDPANIAEKINWLVQLPYEEKSELMKKAKSISKEFSEAKALERFKKEFYRMSNDLLKDS